MNAEIDALKKQLNSQGSQMDPNARASLVQDIETKKKSLQRQAKSAQKAFQQEQNEIAQRILQKMAPVIDKYAKANGYTLLLDSSDPWPQGPLLWAAATRDITNAVVQSYNSPNH
ncbi:MAG: OmpH family outer membrane protein [Candidatus Korobacteraceae bacterium]